MIQKIRPILILSLVFALLLVPLGLVQPVAAAAEPTFDVAASSAVLLDVKTGQTLYAKDPDARLAPASLAKIMTMLLAMEAVDEGKVSIHDTTEVSRSAWELSLRAGSGAISGMYIEVGERVSLEDLLYGVGVSSGNDASVSVAEMLAGNEQAFVQQMNKRAQELGLHQTHFVDSHGLSADAHTTAADMARLAAFFVETQQDGLVYANKTEFTHGGITQRNRNGLLNRDQRVTGLKTGHLSVSGYHLVATAEEGEMSLVAAVLGADSTAGREEISMQLLNYGFRNFRTLSPAWGTGGQKQLIVYKGVEQSVAVRPSKRVVVTVPADQVDQVTAEEDLPTHLEAPVKQGDQVGTLRLRIGEQTVAEFDLVTVETIERGGFVRVILDSIRLFFSGLISRFAR